MLISMSLSPLQLGFEYQVISSNVFSSNTHSIFIFVYGQHLFGSSLPHAIDNIPDPHPTSITVISFVYFSKISKHSIVVSWVPVPKAMPGSNSITTSPCFRCIYFPGWLNYNVFTYMGRFMYFSSTAPIRLGNCGQSHLALSYIPAITGKLAYAVSDDLGSLG